MRRRLLSIILIFILLLLVTTPVFAQDYYFELPRLNVDAYWETDGTLTLDYEYYFVNTPTGHSIEYVDLGLPNSNYSDSNITAWVDDNQVYDISSSGFQGIGTSGVAIGLGQYAIPPGKSGTVKIHVAGIQGVVYNDSKDSKYASAVFSPAYFEQDIIEGVTDFTLTYHFPPGVKPEEPRWHTAPDNFPSEPETGFDDQGRIIYRWHNPNANGYTVYKFGASFPKTNVPAGAIITNNPFAGIGKFISNAIFPLLCIIGFIAIVVSGLASSNRRKQQYLPPKISIEGHGIKRGLTAVEAAILLEQPLDKVMTMILFSLIKKNAAEVITRDPLEIKVSETIPENLQAYETDFLEAFQKKGVDRRLGLKNMILGLVKAVSEKMKGFSRQETIAYYRDITKRAWEQVEAANTPEVKSEKYEEVMEWTMLDKDYRGRTEDVFRNSPVYIPVWWGRFDPGLGRVASGSRTIPVSAGGGAARVPGTDFATSVVTGVESFSSKVVGNINDFTSSITSVTNPPPKPSTTTYKGGGGGGHGCVCACACACAGCACACAGGGRQFIYHQRFGLIHLKTNNRFPKLLKRNDKLPKSGLFSYDFNGPGERSRVHLRMDLDGSGIIIVNANRIMHLNSTACVMAYLFLQQIELHDATKIIRSKFNVTNQQAICDYTHISNQLKELIKPSGACPIHELDLEVTPPFHTRPSAPYRMDLAITYRCNNDCSHCYNARPRNYPELSTQEWHKILDQLWEIGIPHIVFTGGEPTLRTDLPELIEHAEKNGQITGINTNGRRLSDMDYVASLVAAGLDHIQITIESSDPEIHDDMVRSHGAWRKTVAGIKNVLDTSLYVMTNTTMLRNNSSSLEKSLNFLANIGVPTIGLNALIFSGSGRDVNTGLPETDLPTLLSLAREITSLHGQRLIWYTPTQYCNFDPVQLELGVKGCTAALYNMCVESNGDVIPCQSYYESLGNILTKHWNEIWNHELATNLRERKDIPFECKQCALVVECGGGCPLALNNGNHRK